MGQPFLGEVRIMAFSYAPTGWAQCNGQVIGISQNQALFAILGTTFGGNGVNNFQLPDFRGRVPGHPGRSFVAGGKFGEEMHTLMQPEMPQHTHVVSGTNTNGNSQYIQVVFPPPASQNIPASLASIYAPPGESPTTLEPSSMANAGASAPHENRQPFTVLNFCIALQGIFPSRN